MESLNEINGFVWQNRQITWLRLPVWMAEFGG